MGQLLAEDVIGTIRSAARRMAGFKRRQFMAEMAVRYCDGSPRKAESVFGWGRGRFAPG